MKSLREYVEKVKEVIEDYNSNEFFYETTKRAVVIGVCGSACAGKTTLVHELKPILEKELDVKVGIVDEVARDVFKLYFSDFKSLKELRQYPRAYLLFQEEVLREQVHREIIASKVNDIVLTDRTIFDVFLYVYTYLPIEYVFILCEEFNRFTTIYHYSGYDGVILLCPLREFDEDGFREKEDFELAQWHYNLLYNTVRFSSYCRKFLAINEIGQETRIYKALEFVKSILGDDINE